MKIDLKKITIIVLILLIAVISITRITPWAADPANHPHSIAQTDEKISTVMVLSGGVAATSATLSLLPGDICTPIAEQLAELVKYFLLILSALHLEKFLITLSGYISFMILIPLACLAFGFGVVTDSKNARVIGGKLALVAFLIYMIVPLTVFLSDKIYETQAATVESTIEEYNDLDLQEGSDSGVFSEFTTITSNTINNLTHFVSSLLESLAVMLITSCVMPILVFVILAWVIKTLFSTNVLTIDQSSLSAIFRRKKDSE
ncbi:MAG: hypothetical protein IJ803_08800 [Oribacterium sp.]|nr:hypothetical protein [Oribacterium sp.]